MKPNVVCIFQSSEEREPSGAEALVQQGVLENVDAIFGIHLRQSLTKGLIGACHGPMKGVCCAEIIKFLDRLIKYWTG